MVLSKILDQYLSRDLGIMSPSKCLPESIKFVDVDVIANKDPLTLPEQCSCCLVGFNIAFNNFSVISRRCLVATGSSVLTFIVLLH